jgi:exonuclease I
MKKKFLSTKLNNNIIVYDYETGGRDEFTTEPIEISAICADINTLELKTDESGNPLVFSTLVKPTDWSLVQDAALAKNKITREEIEEKGVDQKFAFEQFASFCRSFARSDKKWDQPYAAGFNIDKFDNIISKRLCKKYEYVDKDGDNLLFHPIHTFDLIHIIRTFFAWNDDLAAYNLDAVRDYFGISKEGSHRAEKDVVDAWLILKRFINYYKLLSPKALPKFKGCFVNE